MSSPGASPRGTFRIIELPQIHDPRGDLTPVEGAKDIPFDIARVFFLYNVPVDAERGGHANRTCDQILFALSGSFRVRVDSGDTRADFWLRDPRKGLFISRMVWREMDSFSQGAVLLVLASEHYKEVDYIRDHDAFLSMTRSPDR